jgi:hypothetical protein
MTFNYLSFTVFVLFYTFFTFLPLIKENNNQTDKMQRIINQHVLWVNKFTRKPDDSK